MNSRRNFIKKSAIGLISMNTAKSGLNLSHSYADSDINNDKIPVIDQADICVIGGSCTGVFAAIRAARLGAKVAIIEKHNSFGGVATSGLVNIWHSFKNTEFNKDIIGGLSREVIERLKKRDAVIKYGENDANAFNPFELMIELDELVMEHKIHPYLHTWFSTSIVDTNKVTGVIVENKSGRGIIKAGYFIDATGDGDMCYRLGLDNYVTDLLAPPTTCAILENSEDIADVINSIAAFADEYNLPEGFVWGSVIPGTKTQMLAGTRVYGVNCSNADDLTKAEIEGRRQVRAIMDIIRKHNKGGKLCISGLPSQIGIRETRHIRCQYQLTADDVLHGKPFPDAIANGSYRVDIHHHDKAGITLRYLDGKEIYSRPGRSDEIGRWREASTVNPTHYQIPLRSIIPPRLTNVILAGRMLDADPVAFSAVRVMVNMNQTGEAAGIVSWLALNKNTAVQHIPAHEVRDLLKKGGSIIL